MFNLWPSDANIDSQGGWHRFEHNSVSRLSLLFISSHLPSPDPSGNFLPSNPTDPPSARHWAWCFPGTTLFWINWDWPRIWLEKNQIKSGGHQGTDHKTSTNQKKSSKKCISDSGSCVIKPWAASCWRWESRSSTEKTQRPKHIAINMSSRLKHFHHFVNVREHLSLELLELKLSLPQLLQQVGLPPPEQKSEEPTPENQTDHVASTPICTSSIWFEVI